MRSFFCVSGFAVVFTFFAAGCNSIHEGDRSIGSILNAPEMVAIFEKTLFPEIQTSCAKCHGAGQFPEFGKSDPLAAQDVLLNQNLVDLKDSAASRIVKKAESGHQGFTPEYAQTLARAIQAWSDGLAAIGVNPDQAIDNAPADPMNPEISLDETAAFEKSLHPVLQMKCARCHGDNQSPLFAEPTSVASQKALLDFGLVNLVEPAASRIVRKASGGHQNFGEADAEEIRLAIQSWADLLKEAGGGAIGVTPAVLEPKFSSIHKLILVPKCLGCHSPGGEEPDYDYTDYASSLRTGGIRPGDAKDSGLYEECVSGSMPEGAPSLSEDELEALRNWINNGALND